MKNRNATVTVLLILIFFGTFCTVKAESENPGRGFLVWDILEKREISVDDLPISKDESVLFRESPEDSPMQILRVDKYYDESWGAGVVYIFILARNVSGRSLHDLELEAGVVTHDGYDLMTLGHKKDVWAPSGFMENPRPVNSGELVLFSTAFQGDKDLYDDVYLLDCSVAFSETESSVEDISLTALRISGSTSMWDELSVNLQNRGKEPIEKVTARFGVLDDQGRVIGGSGFVTSAAYWSDGEILSPQFGHVQILPGRNREIRGIPISTFAEKPRYLFGHVWEE